MSSTALKRVPADPSTGPPPVPPPRHGPRRRPSERNALLAGLLVSALLHLLLLFLSRYFITSVPPEPSHATATPEPGAPPVGMRVYRIVPGTEASPPIEAQVPEPAAAPAPPPRQPAEQPAAAEAPGIAPAEAEAPSVTDRLRPRMLDPRLLVLPRDLPPPATSDEAMMRERVYARLRELNDSILAEIEAGRAASDWTIKGPDGQRWGISSEGIHLGPITLPAPRFGAPAGRRDEVNGRLREWAEIQGQADRARVRDRFDERAKAIRERKEQERTQQKQNEKPPEKPPPG